MVVSQEQPFEMLKPDNGKLSSPVLSRESGSNARGLSGMFKQWRGETMQFIDNSFSFFGLTTIPVILFLLKDISQEIMEALTNNNLERIKHLQTKVKLSKKLILYYSRLLNQSKISSSQLKIKNTILTNINFINGGSFFYFNRLKALYSRKYVSNHIKCHSSCYI